jgi:glycyl-tRNA synthetase beta chain
MTTQNLLVELFVEELPPKALQKLGDAFATRAGRPAQGPGPGQRRLGAVTAFASPRRLAAHVTAVADKAADKAVQQKLMPVSVGLDADGKATPALLKKLQALGADVSNPAAAVAASSAPRTARPKRCSTTAWCPAPRWTPACKRRWTKPLPSCPSPR